MKVVIIFLSTPVRQKILLYEKMREKLEKKFHVLEETKTNVDFSTEIWKNPNVPSEY